MSRGYLTYISGYLGGIWGYLGNICEYHGDISVLARGYLGIRRYLSAEAARLSLRARLWFPAALQSFLHTGLLEECLRVFDTRVAFHTSLLPERDGGEGGESKKGGATSLHADFRRMRQKNAQAPASSRTFQALCSRFAWDGLQTELQPSSCGLPWHLDENYTGQQETCGTVCATRTSRSSPLAYFRLPGEEAHDERQAGETDVGATSRQHWARSRAS